MITDFNKYNKINEFNKYITFTDDELLELANATEKKTGIKNVVIWMGPPPPKHSHRIKVSNIPNSFEIDNCFTITIPDFKIIGEVDNSFINKKKLDKIFEFIKLNMDNIILYSERKTETSDFLDNLIKV